MTRIFTTVVRISVLAALVAFAISAAAQQAYPSRPIRLIVPFPPGGSVDPMARLIGTQLAARWGQPVIVDNRPGGNTIIGTEALAKAPPNGYTLILVSSAHVINSLLFAKLPYDAIKDFAPVATVVGTEYILVLHPAVPANNLQEFITLAKSRPGQLNAAGSASGGAQHLAAELFNLLAGVKIQFIPYKGGGPAITDLISGQVQLTFNNAITLMPHIKSGKLKAIAIAGETRSPALPQVPTFSEAGLQNYSAKNWFGILAPAGTSTAIIDKLSTEIASILAAPEVKEKLANQGVDPFISNPSQFAALIRADMAKFAKVIKTANIKIEN